MSFFRGRARERERMAALEAQVADLSTRHQETEERAHAAEALAQEKLAKAEESLTELARTIAISPMLGAPTSPGTPIASRYPLYQWDTPITWSTPQPPTRRPKSYVTLDQLRQLADTYDILRACIQHLKREVAAVPIQLVPKDPDRPVRDCKARVDKAQQFFDIPGGLGGIGQRRSHFESEIIEDLAVIGCAAVYYSPNRAGKPYEAIAIDGATIRPRVDAYGWPGPGDEWYEQWVYGVKVRGFLKEELRFDGLYPVSYSPYFKSPTEWLIQTVYTALKADEWNRLWLTEGNTPSDLIAAPEHWTPEQMMLYYDWFDAMLSGNNPERVKTKLVPAGTSRLQNPTRKDQDFELFQLWLLRRTCSLMGVQPASIGYSGEQYKVSQELSLDQTTQFGAGSLLEFRKALYDDLLERLGFGDLECKNITSQEEDAKNRADRNKLLVASGIKTVNEARADEGLDPIEGGEFPLVDASQIPLHQLIAQSEQATEQQEMALMPSYTEPPPAEEPGGKPGGKPGDKESAPNGGAVTEKPPREAQLKEEAQFGKDNRMQEADLLRADAGKAEGAEGAGKASPSVKAKNAGQTHQGYWVSVNGVPVLVPAGHARPPRHASTSRAREIAQANVHARHAALCHAIERERKRREAEEGEAPRAARVARSQSNPSPAAENGSEGAMLALWERKALNRLRQGRNLTFGFDDQGVLPPDLREWVQATLPECDSPRAVRDLFRAAGRSTEDSLDSQAGIYLVRHARTLWNRDGGSPDRIRGWLDPELSEAGLLEAESIAERLTSLPLSSLLASDLKRAVQTARAISGRLAVPLMDPRPGLRPWNLGDYQGELTEGVLDRLIEHSRLTPDDPVPNGESFNGFKHRAIMELSRVMSGYEMGMTGSIGVVSHYRVFKLIEAWVASGCPRDETIDFNVFESDDTPPGSVLRIFRGENGWQAGRVEF